MNQVPVKPSAEEFVELAQAGNVVPVYAQLAADFETPVSAFLKLRDGKNAFLFESAESTDASGRWSIVGSQPRWIFTSRGDEVTIERGGEVETRNREGDVLDEVQRLMSGYKPVTHGDAPPFFGGAVGYVGYDAAQQFEPTISKCPEDDLKLPESIFFLADTLVVFDHKLRRLLVVANAMLDEASTPDEAYALAVGRIGSVIGMLDRPLHVSPLNGLVDIKAPAPRSNTTQAEYEEMVLKAKDYIAAGDAFQVVPSQRFEADFEGCNIDLYRALRHINPSPYMFVYETPEFSLVGSSPEVHVRSVDGRIDIRPIAGTRWRGETPEEDDALADDLLADEKECAEHVMLIDLARNDVGRISETGTVRVDDQMIVERYSHVMHIVSNVSGRLSPEHSSYDVLRSTFPAGTVSGAPKIRAMQIINSLEKNKRGTYSGAVGYFGWDGNHDSCIALRTCVLKDDKVYIQAGAGVVADSDPTYEYNETVNKAAAMMRAVELAKTLMKP
ncbi:anthranilate synthase component I [Akkermansiaceae bacterium]|nr:anthranilate synthase component I [Verrucomicrobiota bacterium]MDA7515768.1 anthranilate synthase component I [Akkermansiaceae bacterium]MDA7530313.1 anthranilate synthase component I [bacterium]MBT6166304.1 anthranilate synthase component I [Verrucomicrobiota bacterium]MBT7213800.1 anthranilate synthase component I [Verrucomicrobiota bacterium]